MVKCASNHLTGSGALWWNATKREGHRPRTWHAFQRAFKRQFLPSHYKSKARRQWDLVRQNLGEDVQAYIDRFWNCLIQLQTIEHVSKKKLKRKFISGLLPHFGTEVDMFHPHSLAKAISLALHSEKKYIVRAQQGSNHNKKPSFSNNSNRSQSYKPPFKKPFFQDGQQQPL